MTGARAWAAVLLLALVAACTTIPLRDPPRIEITSVSLDRVDGPDAFFTIGATLSNPGRNDVVIDALQARLAIEGEDIAQAALVSGPVRIPANGSADAELVAHTGMDAVLRAVAAAMRRGATLLTPGARPVLHYTLEGSATLSGGTRVPFRRSGNLGDHRE